MNYLTYDYLTKIAVAPEGWAVLFQDPADGRYWELTHPLGHMHGGGPPRLCNITADEAGRRYGV
ncbi:Imm27 family immunity protein [Chelatococcus asaccharovorans]|uniref:Imm27 family immunity protein n=1 Tax=Chelatococcus asaccharovorans TaxID=28210 RepID=UPI00224C6757|nr:Imm27 family immunity protein [Chelatococcus asaccharovorans]CAH1649613.1 hypothetical protein CHELA40_10248 [Chelatococcus asaccharovorans]CAH1686946.1 hypothetical protein CHELA17_65361 [Chelatococcus asaccharovorans]